MKILAATDSRSFVSDSQFSIIYTSAKNIDPLDVPFYQKYAFCSSASFFSPSLSSFFAPPSISECYIVTKLTLKISARLVFVRNLRLKKKTALKYIYLYTGCFLPRLASGNQFRQAETNFVDGRARLRQLEKTVITFFLYIK